MKVINSANFNELYDYIDDDTVEVLDEYENNNFNIVDYDSLENGEVPISDDNVDDILVDNLVDEYGKESEEDGISTEDHLLEEPQLEKEVVEKEVIKDVPTREEKEQQETPLAKESLPDPESDAKEHFGSDIVGALTWAKEQQRVVQIFYNTEGRKRGKGGKQYLKRELNLPKIENGGVHINRIIEPHYFFYAKTTNRWILVTYDRSVRHIRAFAVDNITDYNFTKNKTTGEDQHFNMRNQIRMPSEDKMPINKKPIKGIDNMKNVNENLIEMEAALKAKGLIKSAKVIKNVLDDIKTAQYVGIQGYWIKNRRCWDNCYRQKRTTQPETSAQEVWMECWDEYKKSINNNDSGWEKYASVKKEDWNINNPKEKAWNKSFISKVAIKINKGTSIPEAFYATINEESQVQADKMLEGSSQLMGLADNLYNDGMQELGEKLANISTNMLTNAVEKQAQFKGDSKGWGMLGRGFNKIKNLWTGEGNKSDVVKKIQDVIFRANQFLIRLNKSTQSSNNPTQASSKSIIIEAGKGTKVIKEAKPLSKDPRNIKRRQQNKINPSIKTVNPQGINPYTNVQTTDQGGGFFEPNVKTTPPGGGFSFPNTVDTNKAQDNLEQEEIASQEEQRLQQQQQETQARQESTQPQASPQTQPQAPFKPKSIEGETGKEYVSFINDASQLVKELSGYTTTGDEEVKNYTSQAVPLLQSFINSSNEQRKLPDPSSRVEFLRGSLQNLISGLQGVLSSRGVSQTPSSSFADPTSSTSSTSSTAPTAPTAFPFSTDQTSQTIPASKENNMIDINQIENYPIGVLKPLQTRINKRIMELEGGNNIGNVKKNVASYNHKLKFNK